MSERPPLDAVVFDAGGTLVRLDFEWITEMLAELGAPATTDALRHAEIQGRLLFDATMGLQAVPPAWREGPAATLAPLHAYWGGMLEAASCRGAQLEEGLKRMEARQNSDHFLWAKPMEDARTTLDALAAMGLRLGCVSNSDGRAAAHLERFGLRDGLEFVIDSAIVGIEKPDPRIFALALEKLGVFPARAMYVGDLRSVDEHGSTSAGMQFVLLDPYGTYARRDTPSIAGLAALPAYLEAHFTLPPHRDAVRS